MNILENVLQGTENWLSIRANHFTASEAPVVFGVSKYLDRNELLQQKATGKIAEISNAKQKLFDAGHESESKARILAEEIVGSDLYPVTATLIIDDLPLLASYDGVNLTQDIIWEHKLWSESLAKQVTECSLEPHYSIQLDQQLLISGAEKCLFMTSDGTKDNCVWMWYETSEEKKAALVSAWQQFKKDLANYQPKEHAEKPEPAAIMQLPSLSIQIKGEVTLSNLPEFKQAAETFIANIKTDLQTDEDFANAEATVKFCDETERKLEAAKQSAIGQTASIDELMRTIDHIKDQIRSKRLTLEKSVKNEKENRKKEIIDNAHTIIRNHVEELRKEFKQCDFVLLAQNLTSRQFLESACKNKRTIASLHNAVDTEVAAIKIKLDELARIIRKNLTHLPDDLSLFRDLQSIITKPEDDFKLLIESRLAEQKRKEEEAKERAIAEVKAAEERGRAQAAAVAERERLAKENEEKRIQAIKEAETNRLKQEAIAKAELEARNAEIKRKEEAARAASLEHRTKIIQEARESIESLEDVTLHGILNAIIAGEIKHVTINF